MVKMKSKTKKLTKKQILEFEFRDKLLLFVDKFEEKNKIKTDNRRKFCWDIMRKS